MHLSSLDVWKDLTFHFFSCGLLLTKAFCFISGQQVLMNRIRTQEQQGKSRYEGKSFSFDVGACKQSELIFK